MKIVAFVPIKMNNERVPGKNTKCFDDGTPLIQCILKSLVNIPEIDEIYVYCSNEKIKEYIRNNKIRVFSLLILFITYLIILGYYIDPSPLKTTTTVLHNNFKSNPKLQPVIYSVSNSTTLSKSVISLLPLTCHIPVIPGLMASLFL